MRKDKKLQLNSQLIPNTMTQSSQIASWLKKNNIKKESLQSRNDAIKSNIRLNYINEYDRINNMLSHNITHAHYDHKRLQDRLTKLKELFHGSFNKPKHEIYNT